jgi:DNA-binding CsgD family transcriptional regulator
LQEVRQRRLRAKVLAAAVEIMLVCGDIARARRSADELDSIGRTLATPFMRATAAKARGAVLLAEGEPTAALGMCREALTLWRELNVPYEIARTQVLVAQACRALDDSDSAELELDAARRAFQQLGARLDLASVPPSPAAAHATMGLTNRELQVLRLVATGRTNRAIASQLRLSEKTVARHLANIFNKLDVSSRAAATAYAFEHRLVGPST